MTYGNRDLKTNRYFTPYQMDVGLSTSREFAEYRKSGQDTVSHQEIDQQVKDFLAKGNKVRKLPPQQEGTATGNRLTYPKIPRRTPRR